MKVIHQGFTQVKNAHTMLDWLNKVKFCLLHVNGTEVFIEDRTAIIVWLRCSFWSTLSDDIKRIPTLFLIISSVWPRQNCSQVGKDLLQSCFQTA